MQRHAKAWAARATGKNNATSIAGGVATSRDFIVPADEGLMHGRAVGTWHLQKRLGDGPCAIETLWGVVPMSRFGALREMVASHATRYQRKTPPEGGVCVGFGVCGLAP